MEDLEKPGTPSQASRPVEICQSQSLKIPSKVLQIFDFDQNECQNFGLSNVTYLAFWMLLCCSQVFLGLWFVEIYLLIHPYQTHLNTWPSFVHNHLNGQVFAHLILRINLAKTFDLDDFQRYFDTNSTQISTRRGSRLTAWPRAPSPGRSSWVFTKNSLFFPRICKENLPSGALISWLFCYILLICLTNKSVCWTIRMIIISILFAFTSSHISSIAQRW